jgi:amino acid adenylation domain-containing protein/non-ribosomal peptide synthase protein (TIGR01720 family)
MKHILAFLNELRYSAGAIWVENGAIVFSAPKKFQNQETKTFITDNKSAVIALLTENEIFSKEAFLDREIFRDRSVNYFPLSYAQERLWFIEQYEGGSNVYHIPDIYELGNKTDEDCLIQALCAIVDRHEVLRSTIVITADGQAMQAVHAEPLVVGRVDAGSRETCMKLIQAAANAPFDLEKEYPIRATLYHITNGEPAEPVQRLLLVTKHHIASDGWSNAVLERELRLYYEALVQGDRSVELPMLDIQYKDYALWQRSCLEEGELARQLVYWKDRLLDWQPLQLPLNAPRPAQPDHRGSSHGIGIGLELSHALRKLAQGMGVSLNSVMLSGFGVLLGRYTGQDDIITGSPSANRKHRQTENLIGFFINVQPNRVLLNKNQCFSELINQVHSDQVEAQEHQDLPFEQLVNALGVERDPSRHPLFQVIFEVQGFGGDADTATDGYWQLLPLGGVYAIERFDISVFVDASGEEINCYISYASGLFSATVIEQMARHYMQLLNGLVSQPGRSHSEVPMLDASEYAQLLKKCSGPVCDFPGPQTVTGMFAEQVARLHGTTAVECGSLCTSYGELDSLSQRLAAWLHLHHQTGPGNVVAILLDRTTDLLVAMLGVLKTGAAYVCLDTHAPASRNAFILEDTGAAVLITQSAYAFDLDFYNGNIFAIDLQLSGTALPSDTMWQGPTADEVAYIIYTSGTTGRPKGVMVPHRAIVNYVHNVQAILEPGIRRFDFSTNIAFDLTVTTTLCPLMLGYEVVLYEGELSDADRYVRFLAEKQIHFIKGTPSYLGSLPAKSLKDYRVKQAFVGGEKLGEHPLGHICGYVDCVVDEYGPTETTVGATYAVKKAGEAQKGIGRPYTNYKVYVLDAFGNLAAAGIIGELYIGGAGLAQGYLNRPDLTAARFVANPFATADDIAKGYTKLYRTGDLARWLPDDSLEYIGRNDEQLKIRGYRVEPDEIATVLTQVAGIRDACVSVFEKGTMPRLVGYYVPDGTGRLLSADQILGHLSQVLPAYMLPTALVELNELPLTKNGKLNSSVLPDPVIGAGEDVYVAPSDALQTLICGIWQEVLGVERVGIADNFFSIGGDSILSIQVSGRIRQAGYTCQVKDIFECRTIERLAECLLKNSISANIQSEQGVLSGKFDLLPIQSWFFERFDNGQLPYANHWNQSFLIRVKQFDTGQFERIVGALVEYHDALRMRFFREEEPGTGKNHWKQVYEAKIALPEIKTLDVSGCSDATIGETLTRWQQSFDWNKGFVFQPGYLHGYEDGSVCLFFAFHHLVIDTVSWRILTEDIKSLYEGKVLPPKGSSYRQWVHAVNRYMAGHPLALAYWEDQLKGMPEYSPVSDEAGFSDNFFELGHEHTKALLQQCSGAYHTQINDLLLAALACALKEINHSSVQGVTLEGHGRGDIDPLIDHSHTVGWFTTMFPVRLEVKDTLQATIRGIKENIRAIPAKGISYGSLAAAREGRCSFDALPPVSFNYLGQFDGNDGADWQIITDDSQNIHPANASWNLIKVVGMVSQGKIGFNVVTKLGEGATALLATHFEESLADIIAHCMEKIEKEGGSHTPSDFPNVQISQSLLDKLENTARLQQNEVVAICSASSLQQGFVYHALSQTDDDAYRVQTLFDYHEAIDVPLFLQAWELCIERYPSLRTAFNWDEKLIQVIYKKARLEHHFHDISLIPDQQERDRAIEAIQAADRKQPFDLTVPALLRLHVIKQAADYYTVLKTEHHSIADGWSWPVLFKQVHEYYKELRLGNRPEVKEDTAYLNAQEYIGQQKATMQAYWETALDEAATANDISALFSKPVNLRAYEKPLQLAGIATDIPIALYDRLKALAAKEGITSNVLLQFAWHKILQVYSNSLKSIVGTTVSGRDLPVNGLEESVGLYINTLPLMIDWDNHNSIKEQLHQIQEQLTAANSHSYADLAKIQKNGEKLFYTLLVFENYPALDEDKEMEKISFRAAQEKVSYPLSILAYDYDGAMTVKLKYDADCITEDKAHQILARISQILEQVAATPELPHRQMLLLDADEYDQLIYRWNATEKNHGARKTFCGLFEDRMANWPNNIAVTDGSLALSYQALNERSNQLASTIRQRYAAQTAHAFEPGTPVALCMDRGIEMVVGMLAILKAGGAFVPVDTQYPSERIAYILNDTGAAMVLATRAGQANDDLLRMGAHLVYADLSEDLYQEAIAATSPLHGDEPSALAYIIYTSGTTGKPKGVELTHANLCNLCYNIIDHFGLHRQTIASQLISIAFDGAVSEIFPVLLSGGSLHIVPEQVKQDSSLPAYLQQHKITHLTIPADLLEALDEVVANELQTIHVGGGVNSARCLHRWSKGRKLINAYGPTEGTVCTTMYSYAAGALNTTIGQPISNVKVYVLDTARVPVPVGVIGELYIGGDSLARGYWKQADLTKERFVDNPFAALGNQTGERPKMYKTGDWVRWLPDGNLEFIGRSDEQVKIRGFRIELAEIEYALLQLEGIRQACVLCKERDTEAGAAKYLVAYYVPENSNENPGHAHIMEQLANRLPEYMLPAAILALDAFPLTINGKTDKQALPDPEWGVITSAYAAPVTETEKTICHIWQQVLGLEQIGVNDHFYTIGGDSILSIQVTSRLRQAGLNCQVKDIVHCKTVAVLARFLSEQKQETTIVAEQGVLTGEVSLLPVQQWFMAKVSEAVFTKHNHWNQSFLIKVPELETAKLQRAIEALVWYHDALRMRYVKDAEGAGGTVHWKQYYAAEIPMPTLKVLDVRLGNGQEMEALLTDWQSHFDIEQGPLFQVGYLHGYSDGSARIFFALHHLITDSVSWRILGDDVRCLYEGRSLPAKGSSYRQWTAAVERYAIDHPSEADYWQKQLAGIPRYHIQGGAKAMTHAEFRLGKALTAALLQKAPAAYHTEINDLLLTALAYALKEMNHYDVQGVVLEGHGRENIDASIDHSRTVGWFTTMFPVRLELKDNFTDSIRSVKTSLRHIPGNGVGFGALAANGRLPQLTYQDLPPVSFNYLGQFDMQQSLGHWEIVSEDSGMGIHHGNQYPGLITVNGIVASGTMEFSVVTGLGADTAAQLSAAFENSLTAIIAHCVERLDNEGESYTPSDFGQVRISQALLDRLMAREQALQNTILHIYPANSLQQGFIYHALSQAEDDAYHVQFLYDYHCRLNVDKYIQAWEYCIAQYPILRTSFNHEEDLVQLVHKHGKFSWQYYDITHLATQEERDEAINAIQTEDREHHFDLSSPTLLRIHIIRQAENLCTVIKSQHHITSDGWSGTVLNGTLHSYYNKLMQGRAVTVTEDLSYLEAQKYISEHKAAAQEYWSRELMAVDTANDINPLLSRPVDLNSYKHVSEQGIYSLEVTGDLYGRLKKFCLQEGITINVTVQFVWHKMLQLYSGTAQSIVGTTISGRDLPVAGIEEGVGLYINTLPLIVDWSNGNTVLEQLHVIQKKITELSANGFADLAKLQKNGERLFHSLLIYENYPALRSEEPGEDAIGAISFRGVVEKIDYPLGIIAFEQEGSVTVRIHYDADCLTHEKAAGHAQAMEYMLQQMVEAPHQPCTDISALLPQYRTKVINEWNAADKQYPADETLVGLFERQVAKTPEHIALMFEQTTLTYSQLNEKSNRLARHIREQYLAKTGSELLKDTLIAICVNRSLEMVIGILAILKAGAAYVPIDPDYPQDRIQFIIEDAGVEMILSQQHVAIANSAVLPQRKVVFIDLEETVYDTGDGSNLNLEIEPDALVYVLYTSGTTGKPKGVMLEHFSVAIRILYMIDKSAIDASDCYLFKTNYVFDVSVSDLFGHLCAGSKVQITRYLFDVGELTQLLETGRFTSLHLVPSQYDIIKDVLHVAGLRKIYFSGEAITPAILLGIKSSIQVFNYYGPTETGEITVSTPAGPDEAPVIGKVFPNSYCYVLDANQKLVPPGVAGELYIGGGGLARGYLNRPELTGERFVPDPFAVAAKLTTGNARMYKTGDLVRWQPDGTLEYIGRNDDQVKIRGYRVELGEIEHVLSAMEGIRQACVLVKEKENGPIAAKYLVAYCVPNSSGDPITQEMIMERLLKQLPGYMVPAAVIMLDAFPLTTNGKLNKRALPDPDFTAVPDEYIAPVSDMEKTICRIWEEVLGLDRVGITDHFFSIGGNSISAIQVSHRMGKAMGCDIKVADVFRHASICELLSYNDNKKIEVYVEGEL